MTGTRGGKGERLMDTQNTVLTMLETQNSDIICGIPTGFELSFVAVKHLSLPVFCCVWHKTIMYIFWHVLQQH